MDKFKQDNVLLSEALKKVRDEAEEVRKREDEAVEQVKNSVQVAEQLRMEKTEMEYEIGQLKMQIERQQARIRVLIEEQVVKVANILIKSYSIEDLEAWIIDYISDKKIHFRLTRSAKALNAGVKIR